MTHVYIDIDDTLFFTTAKVRVVRLDTQGNRIVTQVLNNQEYHHYELKEDEFFDYSEHRCSKTFVTTSVPNTHMLELTKELYKQTEKDVFEISLLTAREDFDDGEAVLDFLRSHGLDMGHYKDGKIHLIRCGNIGDIPHIIKREMVESIMAKRELKTIYLYDDSEANLKEMSKLRDKIEVNLFHVVHDEVLEY